MDFQSTPVPNLAVKALELALVDLPGASYTFCSGRELIYRLPLSPTPASRIYTCDLHVKPGRESPEMIVIAPNLSIVANGRTLPHVYPYKGQGTKLCLWNPRHREWVPGMKLAETYIPWTVEWLWYFEDWLVTGEWAGGGEHPPIRKRRKLRSMLSPTLA